MMECGLTRSYNICYKIIKGNQVLVIDPEGRQLDFERDGWDSWGDEV